MYRLSISFCTKTCIGSFIERIYFIGTEIISETETLSMVTTGLTSLSSTVTTQISAETTVETEMLTSTEINTSQRLSTATTSAAVTQPMTTTPSLIQTNSQPVIVTSSTISSIVRGKYSIVYY
jgi:hypothetical protein